MPSLSPHTAREGLRGESGANLEKLGHVQSPDYQQLQSLYASSSGLTDIFQIKSFETRIDRVEDVFATEAVIVCVMILLFKHVLVDTNALFDTWVSCCEGVRTHCYSVTKR